MTTIKKPPAWADAWLNSTCSCGSRLVSVSDYTGAEHAVCAATGWSPEKCNLNSVKA